MSAHGGDVWQAAEELGIAVTDLLDFSANINPRGLPARAAGRLRRDASDPRLQSFYPDPSARVLRNALSLRMEVSPDAIVVGPGAEALLAPILSSVQARRALVPVPAFSEYRRVCEQLRIGFTPFPLERADLFQVPADALCRRIAERDCDLLVLNNPHNPSGAMLEAREVHRLLDATASSGATVLLDEAFIDYVPRASLAREAAARPGLIVLRSLTKFYGCPALRVGYAVAHPDTIERIWKLLPTWPITQLTLDALSEAVTDREYEAASLRENAIEREELAAALRSLGLFVFPSRANYLLIELPADMPSSSNLRMRMLATHRILIRNCDSYEGLAHGRFVRVAVRTGEQNRRLIDALAEQVGIAADFTGC